MRTLIGTLRARRRLVFAIATLTVGGAAAAYVLGTLAIDRAMDDRLRRSATRLAAKPGFTEFAITSGLLSNLSGTAAQSLQAAQLVRATGETVTMPDRPELPVTEQTREIAGGRAPEALEDVEVDGEAGRMITTQLQPDVALQVSARLDRVDAARQALLLGGSILTVVALGAVALSLLPKRFSLTQGGKHELPSERRLS